MTLTTPDTASGVTPSTSTTVHRLFEDAARRHATATAVIQGRDSLTYEELDTRADRLARRLGALGIGPESVVGIRVDRSPAMLVAVLGVLKAGAAYLPFDPAHAVEVVTTGIRDADVAALLVAGPVEPEIAAAVRTVDVTATDDGINVDGTPRRPHLVTPPVHAQNLAYVIFTSGSTGRPKGVAVAHASLVNHALHMKRALGIRPGERVLQFTPLAIDAAMEEILPALLGGATLVLPERRVLSTREFTQLVDDQRVAVVSMPSSYWHRWAEDLCAASAPRPGALRLVFVGGEKLRPDVLRRWYGFDWAEDVQWIADYGPSEATISVTTFEGRSADGVSEDWDTVPIGTPITATAVHVLDENLAPVAPGTTGELYLTGTGLARGYLGRPDLTADRFLPDPCATEPGARMYRTGDLGRRLPDGTLVFAGRVDHQLKVRGHRVEPEQVEAALLRCTGVEEAVVGGTEDADGTRLVAWVVADGFDPARLREEVARLLPPAMVPSLFLRVDGFARAEVSGKLDRSRLPLPSAVDQAGTDTVDPSTLSPLERAVATLFTDLTGRPPASADQDFFAAGGDSLRALQLLTRLEEVTGTELTYAELVAAASVRGIADAVTGHRRKTDAAPHAGQPPFGMSGRTGEHHPASRAQRRLWFLDRLHGGAATYSVPFAHRITGPLDIQRLDAALTTLVARHEALRTVLETSGGTQDVRARVLPPAPVRTTVTRAANLDAARALAAAEARRPFDLTAGPMLRSLCVPYADDAALWVLNVHHAAFDAWSLGVFWSELSELYQGRGLPPVRHQYADFVAWQEAWLAGPEAAAQREFWKRELAGDQVPLRFDGRFRSPSAPAAEPSSHSGGQAPVAVRADLRDRVAHLARRHGTTEFCVLLAAFLATLRRTSSGDSVVVGVPSACRTRRETERMVGYLVNTLAVRMEFTEAMRFGELVDRTSKALSEALARQELPFDEVVDALAPERGTTDNPLFQAMFVLQATPADTRARIDGLGIVEETVHSGTAKVDLTCMLRTDGDGLSGELEYSDAVMDAAGAAGWAAAYGELLSDAVARPGTRVDELRLLAAEGAARRAEAINADHEEPGVLWPLHARFEEFARRTPDAVALEWGMGSTAGLPSGAGSLTYADLNARADRLARSLADAGAGPERLVGICLDRSPDLITALLATLKTGAAFIPLDPAMPVERIRAIAEDAEPVALVTQDRHRRHLAPVGTPLVVEAVGEDTPPGPAHGSVGLDSLAYVYYTSGSTGRPKGVLIDHRCATNRVDWIARRYGMAPGMRILHKTPLIFDVAIWEIFGTLGYGATVLLADAGAEADVAHLNALLKDGEPALAHFVPSMLDAYLEFAPRTEFPGLHWVQTSGEGVPTRLLERFAEHFPVELHNMYGQTETSEVAAWEGRITDSPGAVPMGRQIGIYRLFVLDDALNPVPPGVCGELHVAGLGGLARGYHGRPALTAEKFVPHPYPLEAGERLYRTGDLAWTDRDGMLHYAGRTDTQTKIRGVRVETGEIEAVLERHPRVRNSAVVVREDGAGADGTKELVAYVVGDATVDELGDHLARHLTTYMLPAAYVYLDALPRTASGKTDRLRLPAPTAADRGARVGDAEPKGRLEETLADLWKGVLGLERVGSKDNFFAIGGNSLSSLQILNRVNETFGVEVSLREFFGAPTVEGLAGHVERSLVSMVSGLSDDEVTARLHAAHDKADGGHDNAPDKGGRTA